MHKTFSGFSRQARLKDLTLAVQNCTLCPRLCSKSKILSENNGNVNSKVLFVAEAPGRLGADRTGIPLYGDKTGDNFEILLGNVGWQRNDIFITNAVLCNPNKNGNNDTPSVREIMNCSIYLQMVLELIKPVVIITLGLIALKSANMISPHDIKLKDKVAKPYNWKDTILVPLYHPGPRAVIHRSILNQRSDFMSLAKLVDPLKGFKRNSQIRTSGAFHALDLKKISVFQKVILGIVQSLGRITYFKLTKLLYLIDLLALERLGHTITGEIYLRQQEGPWPPALQKQIPQLKNCEVIITKTRNIPYIQQGPSPRFSVDLNEPYLVIIAEVLSEYGKLSNAQIKTRVYRTHPMRYLLKEEKFGRDVRKLPVIYLDKTAEELDKIE